MTSLVQLWEEFSILLHKHSLRAWGFPGGSDGKESACNAGEVGFVLGREYPLEKGMATQPGIVDWKIAWTEARGRLQSTGSQTVRHD